MRKEIRQTQWGTLATWSLDFIRAMRERNIFAKILFRISLGKYAYREFIGMMDAFQREGYSPYFEYSLEEQEYHRDELPKINWWSNRTPIPLRDESEPNHAST
jgi:hypothetical protein